MRSSFTLLAIAIGFGQQVLAQDLGEFEEEDFQQFFGLIDNGKITKEKLQTRCATKANGFTFTAKDLAVGDGRRLEFNETKLNASVDGRPLRSKYHNAAFGEWTGSTFKPICAGLYLISLDVTLAPGDTSQTGAVDVHLYLRRTGEPRPGQRMTTAYLTGENVKSGHATLVLALRTGDEVSAFFQNAEDETRTIASASFSATKISHIDDLIDEFDSEAWDADLAALEGMTSLPEASE